MSKRLNQSTVLCMALTILSFTRTHAQLSVGIESGYNKNYLITNVSNLVSTKYNPLSGFSFGVPVVYQVADWFSLKAVASFIQKNYQMQRTGFYQGVYQNSTNGYIQLPAMGQFSFGGEALRGFVDIGGYAGYWLTGHVKGTMPNILNQGAYTNTTSNAQPNNVFDEFTPYNFDEKYTFNNTRDKRLELGVLAGAGLSYQLTDTYKLYGGATYYNSLTDLQKKYQTGLVPKYNTTYVFSLGILYAIQ